MSGLGIKKRKKVVLIDGNSLVYRAFFALPTTLALPSGQVTNAVYGFTSMLIRLLIDERPDRIAVAFDTAAPTFRHKEYKEYKAHRDETPSELISQFPLVKDVLEALSITTLEVEGFEADDILATLAKDQEEKGLDVVVVTGDKDAFQLIDDHTRVMTTRRGITDIVLYDREKVIERYGIPPESVPDFLGLKGDSSDNIPGVPGVGDKTAAKLLQQFGSIEDIYRQIEDVKPERIRNNLLEYKDDALISKWLATLIFDVPVEKELSDITPDGWNMEEIKNVFIELRFKTLLERFIDNIAGADSGIEIFLPLSSELEVVEDGAELANRLTSFTDASLLCWTFIYDNKNDSLVVSITKEADGKSLSLVTRLEQERPPVTKNILKNFMADVQSRKNCIFNLKNALPLLKKFDLNVDIFDFDPAIAAYLVSATDEDFALETLLGKYVELRLPENENIYERAAHEGAATRLISIELMPLLEKAGLNDLYNNIELPLEKSLARMEEAGVGLDLEYLRDFSKRLGIDIDRLKKDILKHADEEFNINSPQQLSRILFEKLELKPVKKTKSKSAYATDISVLKKLKGDHPIIDLIISYRELAKLKSTYVDALPPLIDPATKRIHTTFNQMVTATGRLSSSNPNLQNIPVRTELGKEIRRAFIPAHPLEKLLVADYSQIELRLLAHLSSDPLLIGAFTRDEDFHLTTAAQVFDLDPKDVSTEVRRRAKAINFGIIYGISAFGLSEQLEIEAAEAKKLIDNYFERFPQVKKYLESSITRGYEEGYVSTIMGRRRNMPELKNANYQVRSFGERVATNFPLQGSAADIIKLAMIKIDDRLISEGWQTRMVLQVHDELIFEVPPLEESAAYGMVKDEMEKVYELAVPLKVDLSFGNNWEEAK